MPTLYVVATPIGNLGDMTPRAIETLKTVSLIAAEDTRVTQKLLSAFDIHTPLTSCHEHNERSKAAQIVERMLAENIDVAVTTDAGTPCISDPGSILTAEAIKAGIEVLAVPGPTAMASALSVSGFDMTEFTFFGFLPRQKNEL
ncbi:MAG: rRNA small subunit methyltransferase 1, partial [Clostridia bacterium]|nr:rRNA small subunit methyltransferase 1 [Clostridia bacterium]